MNIKELEVMLGISRSNIRFYEKQGLFQPKRKENNYRDYSPADVAALKEIMIYRKMGFTVEEIALILKGQLSYVEGMSTVQERLEEEIVRLEGSLRLVKELSSKYASFEELDPCACWECIQSREQKGEVFKDLLKDYLVFEKTILDIMWNPSLKFVSAIFGTKLGLCSVVASIFLLCVIRGLTRVLIWKESFFAGFSYPWILFGAVSLLLLPVFIFEKKKPTVARIWVRTLLFIAYLILGAVFLFVLISLVKRIFF